MVDEHRLSHSNNANNVAKKKEGGGERKAARTSPEKEGGRDDAKMGEGENITPRVPVIRTRARDDNAKIPGHRRRFCPPVFPWLAFLRFLVIFTPPTTTLSSLPPTTRYCVVLFFDRWRCVPLDRVLFLYGRDHYNFHVTYRQQVWSVGERREKEKEIEFNSNLDNYISTEIEMYLEMHMIWKNFKKRNFKLENGLKWKD